ncbi:MULTISPECIES: hypothetical protein [unclassified Ensifer]|uniref:hypothetical protein n=1 Tax=unclassified Ensifer TaxID=2633371 RepID=UPI00070D7FD8|nr:MULTISPECIES: hypothetical protein [unclassified Ensifer]KQW62692.1 hypothetical protein ASD02_00740 [Ensifer sp. Root1252]KRC83512.1 hypothetical protein ASE32_00735 [Ensifer sp. Root231]KRC86582.1 hypothetical protein ASE47_16915 [Ensifer sp. Root258]
MSNLTIEAVSDLRWADAVQETLTANIKFAEFDEPHPFGMSASAAVQYEHEAEFWQNALAGDYGAIAAYIPPTVEELRAAMPSLTARQLRLGLVTNGIPLSSVTSTIGGMPAGPDKDKAQIEWEYASTFNRMHPLIATVGAALGLTEEEIDNMWLAAAGL